MNADIRHPIFARIYPRMDAMMVRAGVPAHRDELLEGAAGRVLEVGAGHGANFAHYPKSVTEVVAIEPEPRLRRLATEAAISAPVQVAVRAGSAEDLEQDDASFDVAVASLVLCSVRDPVRALAELRRVLRPGGELRFYEHVQAESSGFVRFQRYADVVWPFLAGGCHCSRPTHDWIARSGFTIRDIRRFEFPEGGMPNPSRPHIIGVAVRD
jgi:ubiquinone/menaquinone biosynthesis C-methylase UbiE